MRPSQPRAGGERCGAQGPASLSITLCPRREGSTVCWMKSRVESRGCSLCQGGLIEKCPPWGFFSSLQGSNVLIEGGGRPVWCCLEGSLRCRARR